jgi:AcrR family transcriptional regulator
VDDKTDLPGDSDLLGDQPRQRRAPYADNPSVGERGRQAQLRIMAAALAVFDEHGYHDCGVQRISEVSGVSRSAFYQYFSSKEDVFRNLAGSAGRALMVATESMDTVTADAEGRVALLSWLSDYSRIYSEFEPIFDTFSSAVASDGAVQSGAGRVSEATHASLRRKIKGPAIPRRSVDHAVRTLFETVARLNRTARMVADIPGWDLDRQRLNASMADIWHRVLFGPIQQVNVHDLSLAVPRAGRNPKPANAPADSHLADLHLADLGPAALRTRESLVESALDVFVARGFHATRVADIVSSAGMSHGVFYRYFQSKADIFELLTTRSYERLAGALDDLPEIRYTTDTDPAATNLAAIRDWLAGYSATYTDEAAIVAMWIEATSRNQPTDEATARSMQHSLETLMQFLSPRAFGDTTADAVVLLALLDAMAGRPPTGHRLDHYANFVNAGLLTPPGDR